MSTDLARRKEDKVTGGNVNYYLVVIPGKNGAPDTVVEIEDIIEFCEMLFHSGCVFKALVRLCKLRMDLGKPGSTKVYESEKSVYYSERTIAVSKRRLKALNILTRSLNIIDRLRLKSYFSNPVDIVIHISDPKRLEPYSFTIGDFIHALQPTSNEAVVLECVLTVSLMRKMAWFAMPQEKAWAAKGLDYAKMIAKREKLLPQTVSS